jgi:hypothetical protein
MSLKSFINHDCANYNHDGCIGVSKLFFSKSPPQPSEWNCSVISGQRCSFFEKNLLDLEKSPSPKNEPNLQAMRKKAGQAYRRKHGLEIKPQKTRLCPNCGLPLEKGKHYCATCATKKERERKREHWHRKKAG